MVTHTLIIGTSKSINKDGYYINARKRFWGLIAEAKLSEINDPYKYLDFINETGIGFRELFSAGIFSNDKKLKSKKNIEYVKKGINEFNSFLKETSSENIQNLIFNGKTAAGWFLEFSANGSNNLRPYRYLNQKVVDFEYGKQNFTHMNRQIYILPNTSGANRSFDKTHWVNMWSDMKSFIRD